jgi:hypothetical protein
MENMDAYLVYRSSGSNFKYNLEIKIVSQLEMHVYFTGRTPGALKFEYWKVNLLCCLVENL